MREGRVLRPFSYTITPLSQGTSSKEGRKLHVKDRRRDFVILGVLRTKPKDDMSKRSLTLAANEWPPLKPTGQWACRPGAVQTEDDEPRVSGWLTRCIIFAKGRRRPTHRNPDSFPKTKVVADIAVRAYRLLGLVHGVNVSGRIGRVQIQMPILFLHENIVPKRLETIISLFRARLNWSHAPRQFGRSPSILNLGFEGGSEVEQLQLVVGTPRACSSSKNLFQVYGRYNRFLALKIF